MILLADRLGAAIFTGLTVTAAIVAPPWSSIISANSASCSTRRDPGVCPAAC